MSRSRYRTIKGKLLDFDKFIEVRGSEVSVGNMKINARGDQINAHGEIIKTRNEIMKEKYLDPKAKYNPVRSRAAKVKTFEQVVQVEQNQTQLVSQSQPQLQPQLQPQSQPQLQPRQEPVQEYVKPGVVDIRHRILGQKGFDLRGSLASAVSIDLTTPEIPKPTTLTTLRRI